MSCPVCKEYDELIAEVQTVSMDEALKVRLLDHLRLEHEAHIQREGEASWEGA